MQLRTPRIKTRFSSSIPAIRAILPFIFLVFVFFCAAVHPAWAQQQEKRGKTEARYTVTYNPDGTSTIIGETRWKKAETQKNARCDSSETKSSGVFQSVTKTIADGRDGCSNYTLIFIPRIEEIDFSLTDLPAGALTLEQFVEGSSFKLKTVVRGGSPDDPDRIDVLEFAYNLPQAIDFAPLSSARRKQSKRYTSVRWKLNFANRFVADFQTSGTLQRKTPLCSATAVESGIVAVKPHETWEFVVREVNDYRNAVKADLDAAATANNGELPRTKLSALIFALQISELTQAAFENRTEAGGWAGDFVRGALSVSAADIKRRRTFWVNNQGGCADAVKNESPFICDVSRRIPGRTGISYCNARLFGDEHFASHLKTGFYSAIKRTLIASLLDSTAAGENRAAKIIESYNRIAAEHEQLITKGIQPGFDKIKRDLQKDFRGWASWAERKVIPRVARFLVPEQVRPVRREVLLMVLADLVKERVLTEAERRTVEKTILNRR